MRSRYDRFVGFLFSHPLMRAGSSGDIVRLVTGTAAGALRAVRTEIWFLNGGRLENRDTFIRKTASHIRMSPVELGGGKLSGAPEGYRDIFPGAECGTTRTFFAIRGDGVSPGLLCIVRESSRLWSETETVFCRALVDLLGTALGIARRNEVLRFTENASAALMEFRYSPETLEFEPGISEEHSEPTGYATSAFLRDGDLFFRDIVSSAERAKFTAMKRTGSEKYQTDIFFRGRHRDGEWRRFWFRGYRVGETAEGSPLLEGVLTDVARPYRFEREMANGMAGFSESESGGKKLPAGPSGKADMLLVRSSGSSENVSISDLRTAAHALLRSTGDAANLDAEPVTEKDDSESREYGVLPWLFGLSNAAFLAFRRKDVRFLVNVAPEIPRSLCGDPAGIRRIVLGLLGVIVRGLSGGSVFFEVDGEDIIRGYRLYFRITSTGACATGEGWEIPAAAESLVERMGGEMRVRNEAGSGIDIRLSFLQQRGSMEPLIGPGAVAGKSLLFMHSSSVVLGHVKDICCRLGVQSRFCTTEEDFERDLLGGRFTHAICSVETEQDFIRFESLRKRLAEAGGTLCDLYVLTCADLPVSERFPSDVVLLAEPLLPETLVRLLNGEYCCVRGQEESVAAEASSVSPVLEVRENEFLERIRKLGFLRVDRALRRLGDDVGLYIELLRAFRGDITRSCDVILRAMQRDDSDALILECHSMKSSLRTIGAESLGEEAERLEQEERSGGTEQGRYFSFIASLERLASEVDAVFKEPFGSRGSGLEEKLKEFREALGLFDIQRVRLLLNEIVLDMGECDEALMTELKKHLDLLDYEAAQRVLHDLIARKHHS